MNVSFVVLFLLLYFAEYTPNFLFRTFLNVLCSMTVYCRQQIRTHFLPLFLQNQNSSHSLLVDDGATIFTHLRNQLNNSSAKTENLAMAQAGPSSGNSMFNNTEIVHLHVQEVGGRTLPPTQVGDAAISYICGVERTIRMGKVRQRYAEAMHVPIRRVRFLFHWTQVYDDDTPDTLQMGNKEIILAYHDWS